MAEIPWTQKKPPVKQQAIVPLISEGRRGALTPRKILTALRDLDSGDYAAASKIFFEMKERDIHLQSVMNVRRNSVLSLDMDILPGSLDPKRKDITPRDQEIAAAVRNMWWGIKGRSKALGAMMRTGQGYGVSMVEIHWEVTAAGELIAKKLEPKNCEFLTFYNSANPRRLLDFPRWRTIENPNGEELHPRRFIFHAPLAEDNHPVRTGLYRGLAWTYLFKNMSTKDWLILCEVFGIPLRVGKYSSSADEAAREALKEAVKNLGTDAAAVISDETTIEIIAANITGRAPHKELLDYFENLQSKCILGQTLTTDQKGASSSLAMSEVHERQGGKIITGDARQIEESINEDLIVPYVVWKYGPQEVYPYLQMITDEKEDIEKILESAIKLRELGYEMTKESLQEVTGHELIEINTESSPEKEAKDKDDDEKKDNLENSILINEHMPDGDLHETIKIADRIFASAERLINPAYDDFNDSLESRITDGPELIVPLDDWQIEELPLFSALENVGITAAVAGEASVYAHYLALVKKYGTEALLNETLMNSAEISTELIPEMIITPDEARNWWSTKLSRSADEFNKLAAREKSASFAVARNQDVQAIEKLKQLFETALSDPKSEALTFGGWFKQAKDTGVTFLNRRGAETVFRNNLQSAYGAQRYVAYQREGMRKLFPWYTIMTIDDRSRSETCEELDGRTYPAAHSFWKTHWNPFHHKCRSTVVARSKFETVTVSKTMPDVSRLATGFGNAAFDRFGINDPSKNI